MKFIPLICVSAIWLLVSFSSARAQSFQNLNFESANVAAIPNGQSGGSVSSTNAIPAWNAYLGGNRTQTVLHNAETLGTASVSILGPHWSGTVGSDFGVIIEGNYTVLLQAGNDQASGNLVFVNATINQLGQVPANAASLQFKAYGYGYLTASFGGQNLALAPLASTASYTLFGADISMFAGQVGELSFSATSSPFNYSIYSLDSISFSTQVVPEPGSLIFFGSMCFLFHRRCWRGRVP